MLLYTDVVSGDELISDAYKLIDVDDIVYEVDAAMVVVKEGEVDIGANPSAEEAEEGVDSTEEKVNNIAHSFRLTSTAFDKKSYMTYLKGYLKAVKAHLQETNPDRIPIFEKKAQEFAKKVVANIKDYEFWTGETMNPDGMVPLMNYREDGVTPYFIFWKDGMKEVKL
ncbi:translationally controlled tumor-associated [Atractiella rhizophila]|nr:translationally controlled tumor-associated [Atractiella rhizophila]KAH8914662.1 translationally controlled tumor-associated [Atractiella rhizophila]KAH8925716.1 translationally controlled tumor-associated [Atractiella rhizophila]